MVLFQSPPASRTNLTISTATRASWTSAAGCAAIWASAAAGRSAGRQVEDRLQLGVEFFEVFELVGQGVGLLLVRRDVGIAVDAFEHRGAAGGHGALIGWSAAWIRRRLSASGAAVVEAGSQAADLAEVEDRAGPVGGDQHAAVVFGGVADADLVIGIGVREC